MNKKINIISFTKQGSQKNKELCGHFSTREMPCTGYSVKRWAEEYQLAAMPEQLSNWIGTCWGKEDFVFVGAVGIAVRMIAPWIRDKYTDSAVVVLDEKAQYCIPILSGHVGGGVELAYEIAKWTKAVPVITTATDVQNKFAVDVFAQKNGLQITDRVLAKKITAAVLDGRKIGYYSEFEHDGSIPDELVYCETMDAMDEFDYGIVVAENSRIEEPKKHCLYLQAKSYVVGLGCRKNIAYSKLEDGLQRVMDQLGIEWSELCTIASIDLKKEEPAILKLTQKYSIPFVTYSAEELRTIEHVSSSSEFVASVTGVDNVCERAAKYCCPQGTPILNKVKSDSMTVAVVKRKMDIKF